MIRRVVPNVVMYFLSMLNVLPRSLYSAIDDPSDGDDEWKRAEIDIDLFFGEPFVVIIEVRLSASIFSYM